MNSEQLQKAVPEITSVAEDGLLHEGLHRRRHVPDGLRRKEGHRFDGDVRGIGLHEAGRRVEAHRVGDQAVDGVDVELTKKITEEGDLLLGGVPEEAPRGAGVAEVRQVEGNHPDGGRGAVVGEEPVKVGVVAGTAGHGDDGLLMLVVTRSFQAAIGRVGVLYGQLDAPGGHF